MADKTKIEWTDATWNVINGCSVVSPGCKHCYAMKQAHRFPIRRGLTKRTAGGMVWTGEVRFHDPLLTQPLKWQRPRRIFVCAHGDLFHEKVPDVWIDQVFAVMALANHHTFQVLTKRPEHARDYFDGAWEGRVSEFIDDLKPSSLWNGSAFQARYEMKERGFLPNVWLGTSVEDQQRADERIPHLLGTPAVAHWLSCEPMLGPVDLTSVRARGYDGTFNSLVEQAGVGGKIDWVVVGGESGPGARPMHPGWAISLRDQCRSAGVPFLFKQWGDWRPDDVRGHPPERVHWFSDPGCSYSMLRVGKGAAGRQLAGELHDGYPELIVTRGT